MKLIESGAWARLLNTATGLWLMGAPAVLGYGGPADTLHRIVGPIAATFAIIAIWEATRALRHLNAVAGAVLLIGPLLLGFGGAAMVNSVLCGVLLIGMSRVKGAVEESFGGGWKVLWKGEA